MENDQLVDQYLQRIELDRPKNGPTEEYLNQIHIAHLTHIPFETFDLVDFKDLNVSPDYTLNRLLTQRRGGVCFNMNGLFEFALKNLGYNVEMIPVDVYNDKEKCYYDFYNHVALCITLNDEKKVLCDVGFGKCFLTPLSLRTDCIQYATNGFFRLTKIKNGLDYQLERGYLNKDEKISLPSSSILQTHTIDIDSKRLKWIISYRFPVNYSGITTKIEDFHDSSLRLCNLPDWTLTHCTMCLLHTCEPFIGMLGIVGKDYFEWKVENGVETRTQHPIKDDELKSLLQEKFQLNIERNIKLVNQS